MRNKQADPRIYIRSNIQISPSGCWEWQKCRNNKGYGKSFWFGQIPAHRLAYTAFNGPIPKGLWILHKCDNPPCCNPEHLFAGTCRENHLDMIAKGRKPTQMGESNPSAKLTADLVAQIKAEYIPGPSRGPSRGNGPQIAIKFGISRAAVCMILKGQRWAPIITQKAQGERFRDLEERA